MLNFESSGFNRTFAVSEQLFECSMIVSQAGDCLDIPQWESNMNVAEQTQELAP